MCHSMVSTVQVSLSLGSRAPSWQFPASATRGAGYHRLREVGEVDGVQVRGEPLVQGAARVPPALPGLPMCTVSTGVQLKQYRCTVEYRCTVITV